MPCFIVSPWTTGGYVYTEALDHTSVLMFLEQVFFGGDPVCTNISAWRRSTFGNFLSAFQSAGVATAPLSDTNFSYATVAANEAAQVAITSGTTALAQAVPPAGNQTAPVQQSGSRPSLP